ncbi:MogA/MoaB family molybdenum cofactor biosynthesis protein [Haloarcula sp. 1CSR25-25]|uniref:MogA/MoaB family molybdenum cofactor biosynthesis protein n=1 Tax=Haloarcula sp. 1CSR25-25 TaxID=2862545 RepID=UPI002893F1C6|nr:MogA/MoaB family molybdenum cofactor biosynthesis protein [Haloarcula sp. 1CSR25-25]MDT3434482.1 molybdenum cofactor biosynthesis protein MoaB [Haloarcula sp. 1CSR25-25]
MVDFQSRDTRRGPTDGEDDETDEGETEEGETGDDGESAAADTDAEATTAEPNETADAEASDDEMAASDDDSDATTAADDTAGASDGSVASAAESETSVTARIDEAADRSTDSRSAVETQDTERPTQGDDEDPRPETQSAGRPADTPGDGTPPAADEPPAQTATSAEASRNRRVTVAVVTIGTATEEGDPTGEAVEAALEATGQTVTARERLRGDYDGIQGTVDRLVGRDDVEVVVTAGGLSVAQSEHTLEAVHPLFEKALPGFEEVYRSLLFEQLGTGVIAVRATAGIAERTPVFCLPADPSAARLAIDEIIAAEAPSLVAELS